MLRRFFKSAFALNAPLDTCVPLTNKSAEYSERELVINKPLIQVPIIEEVTQNVLVKEEAIERYISCGTDGNPVLCTRTIPAEYQEVTYSVITGYETVQNAEIVKINVLTKVSDGDILQHCA